MLLLYKYLGKIYETQYKFQEAVEYYDCSAKINPQDKEIWLRLGMSQLNNKMIEEAIISFEKRTKLLRLIQMFKQAGVWL